MRLIKLEVLPYSVRLPAAARDARRDWTERSGALIRLHDDAGRVGQGEASPLPGYSPDTLADCHGALERIASLDLGSIDIGEVAMEELADLPAAGFALWTARLDLDARAKGEALASVLPGGASQSVPLASLLPFGSTDAAVAWARSTWGRGVRTIKVKATRGFPERDAIVAIQRQLGDRLAIRVDANGVWDVEEAREHLHDARSLDLEYVEDPVAAPRWCDLGETGVALAVDEALGTVHEEAALESPDLRALVLKPTRLGGFATCLGWADVAAHRGIGVTVGHLYEGPIGMAACAELALSLRQPLACGLDRHIALEPWSTSPPQIQADSIVSTGLPGLGLPLLDPPPSDDAAR